MVFTIIHRYISDFLQLIFPRNCAGCAQTLLYHEKEICLTCHTEMPFTDYFENERNKIFQKLRAQHPIQKAGALLYFRKKGMVQRMIHQLKYKNNKEVGVILGEMLAQKMIEHHFSDTITAITGVPMATQKLKKRGYNQCDMIIKGILNKMEIRDVSHLFLKVKSTESQTSKSVYERYKNQENIYEINADGLNENEHLLLVDDVITTGATVHQLISLVLSQKPHIKIYVASISVAGG